MSMRLMVEVMHIKVGNPLKKLVLLKLADNASDAGECWPSYQHIADQCELSRTTVIKYIKELERCGLLTLEARKGVKGNSSNLYRLTVQGGARAVPPSTRGELPPSAPRDTRTSNSFESVNESKRIVEQSSTCEVFEHWQTVLNHPRSKLDAKRKRVIQAALKTGYSVEDLKAAISGCSKTPHNMGQNDRGTKFDGIGLILRDAEQIDRFIGNNENAPMQQAQARPMSRIEQVRANLENPALNVINQNEVIGHE